MTNEQYKKLTRIEDELMDLYAGLKTKKCAIDILLTCCAIGHITTNELLGKYRELKK